MLKVTVGVSDPRISLLLKMEKSPKAFPIEQCAVTALNDVGDFNA